MYTYKFRIYPKPEVAELLIKWFGCSRYVWNWGLDRKTLHYKNTGKSLSYLQLKIANQRLDYLHKLSKQLIDENQVIAVENLNIKGMIRNHKLSKYIANASWGRFLEMLKYKAEWYGRQIISVDRFAPTSKMCNKCGYIKQDLKLSDREWTCPRCGTHHDRDINAAQNILKLALTTAGTAGS
jgi:putative transposase